jgi:type IV pilus assembly protein PilO
MARKPSLNLDIAGFLRSFGAQFQGLDSRDPSSWPAIPRYAVFTAIAAAVVAVLWFVWLTDSNDELTAAQAKEITLRTEYQTKAQKAASLDALKKQVVQVEGYVNLLEKQLPSKAEMDALLSDINQAGLGRSLQFDLFRPGQLVVRDYYAELPIALKVTGQYHDIGAFAADIAHLSRIVSSLRASEAVAEAERI